MGSALLRNVFFQSFFIPEPTLTEKNLADQTGRVHLVTGGYTGVGLELCRLLYDKNGTIYIAGRSSEKAKRATQSLREQFPDSKGRVEFLRLDLSDLSTIKPAVQQFMSKESRLDVLTNNAGVMHPPNGSKDKHGHELQLGTNVLGPFCLTQCLLPLLQKTAATSSADSVRVTWASSMAIYYAPSGGGVTFDSAGAPQHLALQYSNYAQSKAANSLLASEFARRYARDGIVSVSWNPGNLWSELQRYTSKVETLLLNFLLYRAKLGGYTELYAACSPEVTAARNGGFIAPWGRFVDLPKDVVLGTKALRDGGNGTAEKLWNWCENEMTRYI